ncbi:unnamed protein product [Cuscuta campestris]|uniref:Uncharacterized protein n=1 Tax=Cuscuta campestris TaxID=132261 RepID=A0A484LI92_9ASTE|nr:unnamed protein product [Cuscuta campestris]
MAKRRREEADSDDGAAIVPAPAASHHSVFIDTDLETHLAMMVSNTDAVSDLKKKILFEHLHSFPEMGEIKIHSVKVKRKGNFYHLPDSMLVKTAFEGTKGDWFLYVSSPVAASQITTKAGNNQAGLLCVKRYDEGALDRGLPNGPSRELGIDTARAKDEHCKDLSSDTCRSSAKRKIAPRMVAQEEAVDTISHELRDDMCGDSSKERPVTKKRKLKHNKDAPHELPLEIPNSLLNNDAQPVLTPESKPSDQDKRESILKNVLTSSNLSDKGSEEKNNQRKRKKKKKSDAIIQQDQEMTPNDDLNCNNSISMLNLTLDRAADEILNVKSSMPIDKHDRINNESDVENIEADPSKGDIEHNKRSKKKKSKKNSVKLQCETGTANIDQIVVPKLDTDDHKNDKTGKIENIVVNMKADEEKWNAKDEKLRETCNPDLGTLEKCLPTQIGETATISSKLDSVQRTESGNTERSRKIKIAKKTARKSQLTLEKADDNDLVTEISSTALNVEFVEPMVDSTAKAEHSKPHTQTCQSIAALEKEEPTGKHVNMQSASCASPEAQKNVENTAGSEKKRKSKKSQTSNQRSSSADPSSVALGVASGLPTLDRFNGRSEDQSLSHCMEIDNASNKVPIDTPIADSLRMEIDKAKESGAEYMSIKKGLSEDGPLQVTQTCTGHFDPENTVKKARHKPKRKKSAAGGTLTALAMNDHEVGVEKLVASNEKMLLVNHPPNVAEGSGTTIDAQLAQVAVTDVKLPESNPNKGQTHENPEDDSEMQLHGQVSNDNDEGVDFRRYFVPRSQGQCAAADKVEKTVKLSRDTKAAEEKSEKGTGPSGSGGLDNSPAQDDSMNDEHENSSNIKLGNGKQDEVKQHSHKNLRVESKKAVPCVSENKKHFDKSTSTPTSSQKSLQSKKDISQSPSNHKILASKQGTSKVTEAITTPTAGSKDKISHNYGDDENGAGLSESSTRTPSRGSSSSSSSLPSSSSDSSENGSELGHHSSSNALNGAKRNNSHERSNLLFKLSSAKKLSMDEILRSSKRFKSARQKAAQLSPEDQPIDLVPVENSEPSKIPFKK